VVNSVEGALEVRVHYVDVLVVHLGVLHHHDDGGKCLVNAAKESEAVMLFAKDAIGF
jgi:rRNA-processing protein FCF1